MMLTFAVCSSEDESFNKSVPDLHDCMTWLYKINSSFFSSIQLSFIWCGDDSVFFFMRWEIWGRIMCIVNPNWDLSTCYIVGLTGCSHCLCHLGIITHCVQTVCYPTIFLICFDETKVRREKGCCLCARVTPTGIQSCRRSLPRGTLLQSRASFQLIEKRDPS